ncbi:MAG TPA: hypothetical protein VLE53_13120 [Gemmatimonadaceae bacterium]|nr:hypothetical protein [Gemmatimonadaceae bacterium]
MPPNNNEYFIEKHRIPVALVLVTGERLNGHLFTQASHRGLSALEDAPEYLNGTERFIPLGLGDRARLIAKAHIVSVETSREHVTTTETYGLPVQVAVTMADGAVHEGQLLLEQVVAHMRVLDHLNHATERFISLFSPERVTLLNRDHVAFVEQVDDGAA